MAPLAVCDDRDDASDKMTNPVKADEKHRKSKEGPNKINWIADVVPAECECEESDYKIEKEK